MLKIKPLNEKQKTIGILLILFTPLFVFIYFNGQHRFKSLANNSFRTLGVIEKLKANSSKGITTRKDVVYFYFIQNDTVFHKIQDLSAGAIKQLGLKIYDSFETKIVKSDYSIFDVNFKKTMDTKINKNNYQIHKYNSIRHKGSIE